MVDIAVTKPDPISVVATELQLAMDATKCHRCGCFQGAVRGIASSQKLQALLSTQIATALALFEPRRYDCLGCETCWPAVAVNAAADLDPALADTSCCATAEPEVREGWPPLPGDYRVLRFQAPVAVCTLNSEAIVPLLERMQPNGLAIVGTLHTENLGIEHLIRNLLPNPNVRFLLLCGQDTQRSIGHLPGQSLLSLMLFGLDESGRIREAAGKRPIIKNVSPNHVELFRRRISVINLIGETNVEVIAAQIGELAGKDPGPCTEPFEENSTVPVEAAKEPSRLVPDPAGYFVLYPDPRTKKLVLEHYTNVGVLTRVFEGSSPTALYASVIEAGLISRLDHAAYLGRELAHAESALRDGTPYIQDRAPGNCEMDEPKPQSSSCGCSQGCH